MKVGNKVVCVDDKFDRSVARHFDQLPVKGRMYTLRAVCLGRSVVAVVKDGKLVPNGGTDAGVTVRVLLEELHNGPDPFKTTEELGFNAERFRELEEDETTAAEPAFQEAESADAWKSRLDVVDVVGTFHATGSRP